VSGMSRTLLYRVNLGQDGTAKLLLVVSPPSRMAHAVQQIQRYAFSKAALNFNVLTDQFEEQYVISLPFLL
jgi:hypothetical protein